MNWILFGTMILLAVVFFRWSFRRQVRKLDTEIAYVF